MASRAPFHIENSNEGTTRGMSTSTCDIRIYIVLHKQLGNSIHATSISNIRICNATWNDSYANFNTSKYTEQCTTHVTTLVELVTPFLLNGMMECIKCLEMDV